MEHKSLPGVYDCKDDSLHLKVHIIAALGAVVDPGFVKMGGGLRGLSGKAPGSSEVLGVFKTFFFNYSSYT